MEDVYREKKKESSDSGDEMYRETLTEQDSSEDDAYRGALEEQDSESGELPLMDDSDSGDSADLGHEQEKEDEYTLTMERTPEEVERIEEETVALADDNDDIEEEQMDAPEELELQDDEQLEIPDEVDE